MKYIKLYAYCLLTIGKKRFTILDTLHNDIFIFENSYLKYLEGLQKYGLSKILEMENHDSEQIVKFFDFLYTNKIIFITEQPDLFPEIKQIRDTNTDVKKAIIDIRNKIFDFNTIFSQLEYLKCDLVEIRVFKSLSFDVITNIIQSFSTVAIDKIILLIPLNYEVDFYCFLNKVEELILLDYRIHFLIYNVSEHILEKIESKEFVIKSSIYFNIQFVKNSVTGCENCGDIKPEKFFSSSIEEFMEKQLFNSCLNRQISIDENGEIKNCPSMQKSWGNINVKSLIHTYNSKDFRFFWDITKDKIEVCKDCELRNLCHDCRAYTEGDALDHYNKPLKCEYNPYA
ncbi:grasp-with-spasm system SPASM domain peptide maturase [Myroides pelagicus]|uniref:Grasp-with-spasm system SPASM domain peptide maturase n=1 Tax=Myroides pelagicus TaxID=270914 RepID=A0A7K1GQ78_9FLAO|nr:grasp-with-spasm system SPASM domain peptide maturase [Myroides pelagicus]MTH31016.1 grasp-with-spasm system SPASM domain peptide maturase [Myroides pelagicus]